MSDTHARFCWTTRLCRIMLLHRGMSLSLGGDYDFDPYAMSLLSWDEHRGPAHLHYTMRRTPDPVPLCPLCTVFFRNTSYPLAQLKTPIALVVQVLAALTEGAGLNAATRLYSVSKNSIYRWQERLSGLKNPAAVRINPPVSATVH